MSNSPTFICTFADGEITRMSVWHESRNAPLDLDRGVRLACVAYESRAKRKPPAITEARFLRDGVALKEYGADDLKGFNALIASTTGSKYPPAEPGALGLGPPGAAKGVADAAP
jgi:hypothetical protein